jgi:integrase
MTDSLVVQNLARLDAITAVREEKSKQWSSQAIEISLEEAVEAYLSTITNEHTQKAKKSDLGYFRKHLEANSIHTLGDLGTLIAQELMAQIEFHLDHRLTQGRSVMTVQRQKGSIIKWLEFLKTNFPDLITIVPHLTNPNHKAYRSKGKTDHLTLEQWFRLKDAIYQDLEKEGKRNKRVASERRRLLTMCYTSLLLGGRRLGEVLQMQWKDIDFEKKQVAVQPLKSREDDTVHYLPLCSQLEEVLKEYRQKLLYRFDKEDKVFPVSPQNASRNIKKYGEIAGIQDLSFHFLRVTFITWCIEQGDTMSEILNATLHKTPSMIRFYDRTDVLINNSIHKMGRI